MEGRIIAVHCPCCKEKLVINVENDQIIVNTASVSLSSKDEIHALEKMNIEVG